MRKHFHVLSSELFASAINILSVSYLNNPDREFIRLNRIYNSVTSLAQSISLLAGQFFESRGPWIIC